MINLTPETLAKEVKRVMELDAARDKPVSIGDCFRIAKERKEGIRLPRSEVAALDFYANAATMIDIICTQQAYLIDARNTLRMFEDYKFGDSDVTHAIHQTLTKLTQATVGL